MECSACKCAKRWIGVRFQEALLGIGARGRKAGAREEHPQAGPAWFGAEGVEASGWTT